MLVSFAELLISCDLVTGLLSASPTQCHLCMFRTCNTNYAMVQDTLNVQDAAVSVEAK